ncbi:MAG: tRNA dihydrouridine synthase DusB [Termitinemataceae bacterium]|nr:MAG: tRNA dihydrouridine synthase DusB [Termitinemataceae bacterium]
MQSSFPLLRPVTVGSLKLAGNLFLAPVAGWSSSAFRSICIENGADFTFTELVSSESLVRNTVDVKKISILHRAANEKHYAIQLFGANPDTVYKAACLLEPLHPDMIDLNAGCPVAKVIKQGAGSALMRNVPLLAKIISALKKASTEYLENIPISVKMRSGWDAGSLNYAECAQAAVEAGADMVTLHARTRTQGYEGESNTMHIADLVTRIGSKVPVTASGDLRDAQSAMTILRDTGCAAVMFARGAMGNPWIFSRTKYPEKPMPDTSEKLKTAFRHLDLLTSLLGEKSACLEMRKIFCAYTKGIPGGAVLRKLLVHASSMEEYRNILSTCGCL